MMCVDDSKTKLFTVHGVNNKPKPTDLAGSTQEKGRLLKERVEVDLSSVYRFLDLRKWELEAKIDEEVCRTVQPLQEDLAKICLEACTIEQTIRDVQLQLSYGEPQEMLQVRSSRQPTLVKHAMDLHHSSSLFRVSVT